MAQIKKFSKAALVNQLRHVDRKIKYPKNTDIDFDRSRNNYVLSPDRKMSSYDYLKQRIGELHHANREDIRFMAGWVITAPKELETDQEIDVFFRACYDFLSARYGEKNCVRAAVHKDESGRPHLHFDFIPVTKNNNPMNENIKRAKRLREEEPDWTLSQMAEKLECSKSAVHKWLNMETQPEEKICANDVLNKKELMRFHPDLQKYLNKNGIKGKVVTGITKRQGGNMTVDQLKAQRNHLLEHGDNIDAVIKSIDAAISLVEASEEIDQNTMTEHGVEITNFDL